jgi:hypothetical protein
MHVYNSRNYKKGEVMNNLHEQVLVIRYGLGKKRLAQWKTCHEKIAWLQFRASQTYNDVHRHKLLERADSYLRSANKILDEAHRTLCKNDPNKNKFQQ